MPLGERGARTPAGLGHRYRQPKKRKEKRTSHHRGISLRKDGQKNAKKKEYSGANGATLLVEPKQLRRNSDNLSEAPETETLFYGRSRNGSPDEMSVRYRESRSSYIASSDSNHAGSRKFREGVATTQHYLS